MSLHQRNSDRNLTWKVTTQPAIEPITASNVKDYARIDGSSENTLIEAFIEAVRGATEKFLGRALINQTITVSMDEFGYSSYYNRPLYLQSGNQGEVIELPRPPLVSVTEVRTVAEDDTTTTYDSDNYYVRTNPDPGQLVIKFGRTPPINTDRFHGGYEIEFIAGYGEDVEDVPQAIRTGMTMWVADIYENRVPISEPPGIVKTIMAPYRVIPI